MQAAYLAVLVLTFLAITAVSVFMLVKLFAGQR